MGSPEFSDDSVFSALLCLSDDEIVEKLRVMDIVQIVEFSLLSERCKELVKSIKIQGFRIIVNIHSQVIVHFKLESHSRCTLKFRNMNREMITDLKVPLHVAIRVTDELNGREKTIQKDQFEMEDWMEHFYTIFNFRGTDLITFNAWSKEYDPEDLKKYFGMPSRLHIEHTRNYANNQRILKTFLPANSLTIAPDVFENSKIPPEILIQQFTMLTIAEDSVLDNPSVVTLEDLLIINSKSIRIHKPLSPKDINKFIKLWQHGTNPRMEYLDIECDVNEKEDQETVLKGIKCTEIPDSERRSFRLADPKDRWQNVRGGIDVWRMDGVRATIQMDPDGFRMFIWFDHCIV